MNKKEREKGRKKRGREKERKKEKKRKRRGRKRREKGRKAKGREGGRKERRKKGSKEGTLFIDVHSAIVEIFKFALLQMTRRAKNYYFNETRCRYQK